MTCEAEHRPLGVFECQLCALAAPYSYVGQKPPDTQSVILLEESYVMKDPFTPDKDRFLILGSRCSVCGRLVCVGPLPVRPGARPAPARLRPCPSSARPPPPGMQSVLLQEVLPPLCPEEPPGFPSGDPAGPGEKERPREEAGRPAQLAGLSRRRRPPVGC
uniref:Cysteine-rich DPF motif domain-containing protein 1 n=1 Tax=Myotis myotis TaxID=51298 RepID=A0A7J7Z1F7_MYOMY|nr:cysteine rich DPF motif domain containing 1 [Myotis myotis]